MVVEPAPPGGDADIGGDKGSKFDMAAVSVT